MEMSTIIIPVLQRLRHCLFIRQRTSNTRQRRDLFGRVKLPSVTTSLTTQKVDAISLSALPKDITNQLAGLFSPYLFNAERQAGKL